MNLERSTHLHRIRSLPHCVYRAYDEDGALLYVGCSVDPHRRKIQHRYKSDWFQFVVRWDEQWYPTWGEARWVEQQALTSEAPVYNRTVPKSPYWLYEKPDTDESEAA